MELPVRQRLSHSVPHWLPDGSWFFLTINGVPRGANQLCLPGIGEQVLDAIAHNHQTFVWNCRLALLMPDHLHAIIAFPRESGLKTTISNWKRFTARKTGVLWQRDFFDHRLRGQWELEEKTQYILLNPVRKDLCKQPEEWPWILKPEPR